MRPKCWKVLLVFNAGPQLYGLERAVIETFDLLRPDVEPHFLVSQTDQRLNPPTFAEIKRRGFNHSFFSDRDGWPRIGWPRSFRHLSQMLLVMLRANLDVLKAAKGKDCLYIPGTTYFYFAFLAALWCRIRRRRVIYHFHNLVTQPSFLLRLISLLVTDFVHNTAYGLNVVRKANPGIGRRRNWIIPYPILARPASLTGNGHFTKAGVNLLFVGQVEKHKGIDLLLDAFARLRKSNENLTLHIVGSGGDADLVKLIDAMNTRSDSQIKYWGYCDDVFELMKKSALLVAASPAATNESFGRVIVEAMSVGLPAVCFRSGAFQEIVAHEETGLICEDESAESLAKTIQRFLSNEEFRSRCGNQALSRYQELYSATHIKNLWLELFGKN